MSTALVVVDIQNDYFPGGAMELVGSVEAAIVANSIQKDFRKNGLPVIHVQHVATSPNATFFLPNTSGVEIHESVKPLENEKVIVKHFPNSFRETELLKTLNDLNVTKLTIIGMMTHMCIDSTVRAANDLGFSVTVYENACATTNLTLRDHTSKAADVQVAFLSALDGSFATVKSFK